MAKGLLIVDVQNDFTEGGALAVAGGDDIARGISVYLAARANDYAAIIASRDWHEGDTDNGGHFSPDPDFVDTWPVHCVADTPGAEYDPLLNTSAVTDHIRKGQGVPAYSAFEGSTDVGEGLPALLHRLSITELDVVGIATDHCVRASVLDARTIGLEVRVLGRLVAGVGVDSSAAALFEMESAGAEVS